jgi:hypothetical protein
VIQTLRRLFSRNSFGRVREFKELAAEDVTETIATAMQKADVIKTILIVFEYKEDYEGGATHGVIIPDETTIAQANFLVDVAKRWLLE